MCSDAPFVFSGPLLFLGTPASAPSERCCSSLPALSAGQSTASVSIQIRTATGFLAFPALLLSGAPFPPLGAASRLPPSLSALQARARS